MNLKEILFKARLKDGSGWVFWDICGCLTSHTGKSKRYDRKTRFGISCYYRVEQMMSQIDTNTISLSTGFKDKNKKRVFDGDIVKVNLIGSGREYIGEVARNDGGLCIVETYSGDDYPLTAFCPQEVQVVSNVYDNPDFIKEMQNED